MSRILATVLLILTQLATGTSAAAQAPVATQASNPQAALAAQAARWIDAFERGDAETLASLFTEDAVYAANTGQVFRGRAAIREGVAGWMTGPLAEAQRLTGSKMDVHSQPLKFDIGPQLAYGLSRFAIRLDPADCILDSGHTLAVWQLQPNGEWLISAFLGNQDKAPPPNPCRRAERG